LPVFMIPRFFGSFLLVSTPFFGILPSPSGGFRFERPFSSCPVMPSQSPVLMYRFAVPVWLWKTPYLRGSASSLVNSCAVLPVPVDLRSCFSAPRSSQARSGARGFRFRSSPTFFFVRFWRRGLSCDRAAVNPPPWLLLVPYLAEVGPRSLNPSCCFACFFYPWFDKSLSCLLFTFRSSPYSIFHRFCS